MLPIVYSDILEIRYFIQHLVQEEKYNPHHGANGRFTSADQAHISIARDGTRTRGPKHPDHPNNKLSSTQKIEKAMHEKHPNTYFCFDGIEPAYAQKMADHIDTLMKAYPDVKLDFVGVPKPKKNVNDIEGTPYFALKDGEFSYPSDTANAYLSTKTWIGSGNFGLSKKGATYYSTAMILNPKVFTTEKAVLEKSAKSYANGWYPKGIPLEDRSIATITHEFGHAIHSHLLYGGVGKAMPGLTAIGKHREGEVSRMTDYWTNLHRKDEAAVSGYVRGAAKETRPNTPDFGKKRATSEAIAEAFKQMTLAPQSSWTPYTKSLHTFLHDTYSQPWNDKPKKVDMTKDSPVSRALKKKLDSLATQLQKSKAMYSVLPPIPGGEIFLYDPKPHVEITLPSGPEGVFDDIK